MNTNKECDPINTDMDLNCPPDKPIRVPLTQTPYTVEVTRIHKKVFAPKGTAYIVIRYKDRKNNMKYESSVRVMTEGLNEDSVKNTSIVLWQRLKQKYDL